MTNSEKQAAKCSTETLTRETYIHTSEKGGRKNQQQPKHSLILWKGDFEWEAITNQARMRSSGTKQKEAKGLN